MNNKIAAQKLRQLSKDELHDNLIVAVEAIVMLDKTIGSITRTKQAEKYGCFEYIAYNPGEFLLKMRYARQILAALKRNDDIKFLDVGCGVGTKVLLASQLFSQADGLEYDQHYYAAARRTISANKVKNSRIIKGDALVFPAYGEYDIIYLYRPFFDLVKQNELEMKIMSDAKPDTIIVCPSCNFDELPPSHRPVKLFDFLYIKCSPARGKKIREKIKHIRPELLGHDWRSSTKKLRLLLDQQETNNGHTKTTIRKTNGQPTTVEMAIKQLSKVSPRQADLATYRIKYGFSVSTSAEIVGVSATTGIRDWQLIKRWIRNFIPDWVPPPLLSRS